MLRMVLVLWSLEIVLLISHSSYGMDAFGKEQYPIIETNYDTVVGDNISDHYMQLYSHEVCQYALSFLFIEDKYSLRLLILGPSLFIRIGKIFLLILHHFVSLVKPRSAMSKSTLILPEVGSNGDFENLNTWKISGLYFSTTNTLDKNY